MRTVRALLLLILATLLLPASDLFAQQTSTPKRVVVLYWYDKNFIGHVRWDAGFKSALQPAPALGFRLRVKIAAGITNATARRRIWRIPARSIGDFAQRRRGHPGYLIQRFTPQSEL